MVVGHLRGGRLPESGLPPLRFGQPASKFQM
jgi:hypothetical protein